MNTTYERLMSLLDSRELRYVCNDDNQSVCVDFGGDIAVFRIIAQVDEIAELFQVFGYVPNRIPEGSKAAITETLTRANFGLRVGKFEFDIEQGQVRFQISQIITADGLDEGVMDRLISTTLSMLEMYLPAILSVIYGNELPKDAIRCVEAGLCGYDTDGADTDNPDDTSGTDSS